MTNLRLSTVVFLICATLPSLADQPIQISYQGSTALLNQQPGDSNNFIDFFSGNYYDQQSHNGVVINGTTTSNLTNFSIAGGVTTQNNPGDGVNFATITTPLGQSFLTGTLAAYSAGPNGESEIAFAFEPIVANGFNLDNFNLYLMISNSNGVDNDLSLEVDPRSSTQNGGVFGQGAGASATATAFPDNTNMTMDGSSPPTARYLIFNVQGLQTAISEGYNPDLVIVANASTTAAYVGGVSIGAVPEPSTYALSLGGVGALVFLLRIRALKV